MRPFAVLVVVGVLLVGGATVAEESARPDHDLKLTRPSSNPVLDGTVVVKGVDLKTDGPFLRVRMADGGWRDYLIKTCDERCQSILSACKNGEQCTIRGKVEENPPSIMAEFVKVDTGGSPSDETRKTKSGYVFARDRSNPKLGEAWRDPTGMIWGDIVRAENGSARFMSHEDAVEYCDSICSALPSREDLMRLRRYMGATSRAPEVFPDYEPQVLPNLNYTKEGKTLGYGFWSSTIAPGRADLAYFLDGNNGELRDYVRQRADAFSVRCVAVSQAEADRRAEDLRDAIKSALVPKKDR